MNIRPSITAAWTTLFLLLPAAGATSICRWVDESGQVQFSDVMPDKYTSGVTCTRSETVEPTAEQRAAIKRAKDLSAKSAAPANAVVRPTPAQEAAPPPVAKQPAEVVTDSTDCTTWRRLYDESGACFALFRTVGGGIKPEAFAKCNEIPNPEAKCGPERN